MSEPLYRIVWRSSADGDQHTPGFPRPWHDMLRALRAERRLMGDLRSAVRVERTDA
jgi:hypothetical protein